MEVFSPGGPPAHVQYYSRAQCRGHVAHSLQYGRAKVRNNCWAQAVFPEGADDAPKLVQYACHIQFQPSPTHWTPHQLRAQGGAA